MKRERSRPESLMWTPGIWSTDDYIRGWASLHARDADECVVPLQSLHGRWVARVRLRAAGQPVERLMEADDASVDGSTVTADLEEKREEGATLATTAAEDIARLS